MNLFVRIVFMSVFFFGTFMLTIFRDDNEHVKEKNSKNPPKSVVVSTITGQKSIILERVYVDGEVSEEIVHVKRLNTEEVMAKYEDWLLVYLDDDQIVLQKKVDDISPLLKANGYFGISEDGTISIFNGKPSHSDIIQSFFQIDIKKLEGKKHEELKKGIPIKSKEDYDKVLDALRRYSIPTTKE